MGMFQLVDKTIELSQQLYEKQNNIIALAPVKASHIQIHTLTQDEMHTQHRIYLFMTNLYFNMSIYEQGQS